MEFSLIASTSHISLLSQSSRLTLLTITRLNAGDYGGKGTICNYYLRTRGKKSFFFFAVRPAKEEYGKLFIASHLESFGIHRSSKKSGLRVFV